jgi:hypothetical protein
MWPQFPHTLAIVTSTDRQPCRPEPDAIARLSSGSLSDQSSRKDDARSCILPIEATFIEINYQGLRASVVQIYFRPQRSKGNEPLGVTDYVVG